MDSARKRSASAAHLPFSTSTKKRQANQPSSTPVKSSPLTFASTSFDSHSSVPDIANAFSSEPSRKKSRDSLGDYSVHPSSIAPHLNGTNAKEEENGFQNTSPIEEAETPRISEPPSQDQESSAGSPVPSTPQADSPSSAVQNSYFDSMSNSERSTPLSVAIHKRGIRKPFLREGFRYRVHPLKGQHDREKKAELSAEIYRMKRAAGYGQDLGTYRSYLSYRERIEQYITATDKKMPPPQTTGPESIPPFPSLNYLQRAIQIAKKTINSPRPAVPKFTTSELLARRNKERDDEIERRLRPKLPDSLPLEQEKVVRESLSNRAFLAKAAREQVGLTDLSRLKPGQWLNDEIINFYGALISERAARFEEESAKKEAVKPPDGEAASLNGKGKGKTRANDFPGMEEIGNPLKVHVFNTFFLAKLQDQGYDKGKLSKWTKKVDIFTKDLVLIPCNLGNSHWTCASINFRDQRIEYYDSLGMDRPIIREALRTYIQKEHLDKKREPFNFEGWTDFFPDNSPQQENGYDCGVFLCQTMENLSRGVPVPFDFTQTNMPYLRRRMIWEIARQQLSISRI